MNDVTTSSSHAKTSANSSSQGSSHSSLLQSGSSIVQLSRSKQTWTGAGSAAGFVLRYLAPMRRLMMDVMGDVNEADRSLAILIAHLVKAGYAGHDKGRLRDFLIRGVRSAGKARFEEATEAYKSDPLKNPKTPQPKMEAAQLESPKWIGFWREGLLQRSWRSLERHQHAQRHQRPSEDELVPDDLAAEDLVHDVLKTAMSNSNETPELWANRVAAMSGRRVTADEVKQQLETARIRFAQQVADEVAQTLEEPTPEAIQAEIKALGLQKAFSGVKVQA